MSTPSDFSHAPFSEAVIELADANREADLARLLAERTHLESDAVLLAIAGHDTEPAAAVCRIAGLPLNSYSAVLRMRVRKRRQVVDPYPLLAAYRKLSDLPPAVLAKLALGPSRIRPR
ncbi:MAG: hypothetical protein J0H62_03245 [Rhizobiales bacterium]|nr:hypothetical protein [Hyphomicrobiales bacterium]